jgi:hypothetical protein
MAFAIAALGVQTPSRIEGMAASLEEVAAIFRDHLNAVLARTVTRTRLVPLKVKTGIQIAFRQGGAPTEALLHTRYGRMALYLGQTCESVVTEQRAHRLRTVSYRYTLRHDDSQEPVFRWEYEKHPPHPGMHCRHHLQGDIPLRIGRRELSLNDLHLPTGFVTLEEVLRFCIVDLQVEPLSDNWHEILAESYEHFKTDFAPRGRLYEGA